MCGPTANTVFKDAGRAVADATTFGTYEGIRKLKSPIAQAPEKIGSTVGTLLGAPPEMPSLPTPPDAGSASGGGGDAGPEPTPSGPAPTETAAMAAKRRLAALRMGLLSTIATSGQGVTSAPNLFQPSAFAVGASGMKTSLGQ